MDQDSQKRFDEITTKEPAALSAADVEFLRARSSYLTAEQREVYREVLGEPSEAAPQSKRSKKDE